MFHIYFADIMVCFLRDEEGTLTVNEKLEGNWIGNGYVDQKQTSRPKKLLDL